MSKVNFITGACNSGKSMRFLQHYLETGITDTGLLSRKRLDAIGSVDGYDIILLPDKGMQRPLAYLCAEAERFAETERLFHGRFVFSKSVFDDATAYVQSHPSPHVWIDEIGKLELQGLGHAQLLHYLLDNHIRLTLTIRDIYLPAFLSAYSITDYQILNDSSNSIPRGNTMLFSK